MIQAAEELSQPLGLSGACRALAIPRRWIYRERELRQKPDPADKPRRSCPRALSSVEQQEVLQVLNSERFQDETPREVYATLLDEGQYLCSWRSMYRILAANRQVRERRNQLRHPRYQKPELLAEGPNQLWSWDITKLRGPGKWTYFYLYVILDVYSRYVVGWMIALQEAAHLAVRLIAETCQRQNIPPGQLTLHADRGTAMISKPVALLLADLGVTKTHSRPHVSNDNPYSEAHFKTLKYRPDFPQRFGSLEDARLWARALFTWYNDWHHHTGLGLLTPAVVHFGQAAQVLSQRQRVLAAAFEKNRQRFVKGQPLLQTLPSAVWINPPKGLSGQTLSSQSASFAELLPVGQDPVKGGDRSLVAERSDPLTGWPEGTQSPARSGLAG